MGHRVAAISAMVIAIACGSHGGGGETAVERKLRGAIAGVLGAPVARVKCAGPAAAPASCVATVDGAALPVAVKDTGTQLAWDITGLVVRGAALEAKVAAMLGELEVTARIACGPRFQVVTPGARVTCTIAAATRGGSAVADTGAAWATIEADGTANVELALGAEAVAARTTDVATTDLDALSRALDVGGDDDDDGETAPAPTDAAPPRSDAAP